MIWFWSAPNTYAQQIELERLTVLTTEESFAAGWGMHFIELSYSLQGVTDDYLIVIHKFDGELPERYDTIRVGDFPDRKWYDPYAFPNMGSERYYLELLDDQGFSIVAGTPSHGSVFLHRLRQQQINHCEGLIVLQWDNYVFRETIGTPDDLPSFFTHNQIMLLPPGSATEVAVDKLPFSDTTYAYSFGYGPGTYRFRIQAIEEVGGSVLRTSNSNYWEVDYERPELDELNITRVDVVNNQDIEVTVSVTEGAFGNADDFDYLVYRSDTSGGPFVFVGMAGPTTFVDQYSLSDEGVPDILSGPYYYQVAARLKACAEGDSLLSNRVSSLFLDETGTGYTDTDVEISLQGFHDPDGAFCTYELYRWLPDASGWEMLASLGTNLVYTDVIALADYDSGDVRYRLMGTCGTEEVLSNEITVTIRVVFEEVNAFYPESSHLANQHFRPGFKGSLPDFYYLVIYNRWGQEIYSQRNPSDSWPGWDGRNNDGWEVPQGVYGYKLDYQFAGGDREEKRGTVMLIR